MKGGGANSQPHRPLLTAIVFTNRTPGADTAQKQQCGLVSTGWNLIRATLWSGGSFVYITTHFKDPDRFFWRMSHSAFIR
mmetsp:Transcript_3091/g.6652  ORF Transcript_3091/g.6652 Transcript_3091/m.6652 type:complete len:80 (+) Transcript_3091:990-1229(+)